MGVHYPSDSAASRHLAGGVWNAIFGVVEPAQRIDVPTLRHVLARAGAEWS